MSKPTNKPGWNPTDPAKTLDPGVKKVQGWISGEMPSAQHFNWLMKTVSEWVEHIDADVGNRLSSIEGALPRVSQINIPIVNFTHGGSQTATQFDAGRASTAINGVKTINWANGGSQSLILDSDCSITYTGAVVGNTYYLCVQQDDTSPNYSITGWPQGTVWAQGAPVITKKLRAIDVVGVYFDGTNYFSFITQNYYNPPIVVNGPTNGYCAGGASGTAGSYISSVNKMSFANDTLWKNCQREWGRAANSQSYAGISTTNLSAGTQTTTNGYQLKNGSSNLKLSFANDVGSVSSLSIASTYLNAGIQGIAQNSVRAIGFSNTGSNLTTRYTWKYLFSSDTSSNLGSASSSGGVASYDGVAASFSDYGAHFQDHVTTTYSFPVTISSTSDDSFTAVVWLNAANLLRAEGLYDNDYAYLTRGGSVTKWDKVTYSSSNIAMASPPQYRGSAGVQNSANGYWLGGATTSGGTSGSNVVRKLNFAASTNSIMGSTLPEAKILSAGFEG